MIRTASVLLRRYSHVNWALADQAVNSGVNFLTGIILARELGIEEFGRFTLAWMVVLLVNTIQTAMVNSPMMSLGPKQAADNAATYYGAVVAQQAVFSCGVFVVTLAATELATYVFPSWGLDGMALPLAATTFTVSFQEFARRYFFTRGKAHMAFTNDVIRYLLQIVIIVWMFATFQESMDITRVLWIMALAAALAVAGTSFAADRLQWTWAALRTTAARHWEFSRWLVGGNILSMFNEQFFVVVGSTLLGPTAVGAWRAGQNLMRISHFIMMGLANVIPVQASRHLVEGGRPGLRNYLLQVFLSGGLAIGFIAAVLCVAPRFWLSLVYGEEYAAYSSILRWYGIIYILFYGQLVLQCGLMAAEKTSQIFKALAISSLFSLVVSYPLTQYFELQGMMTGIFFAQVIVVGLFWKRVADFLRGAPASSEATQ